MSDEQNEESHTTRNVESMTARLASLRASIKASKARQSGPSDDEEPEAEAQAESAAEDAHLAEEAADPGESEPAQESDDDLSATMVNEPATLVNEPAAVSAGQSPSDIEPDDVADEFIADETQLTSSQELALEDAIDEPEDDAAESEETESEPEAPSELRRSGEQFSTGDLHRVRPSDEDVLGGEESLVEQMNQVAEEANRSGEQTSGDDAATLVQKMDDLSFVQGTPLYMSPEQCRNDAVDPATDVYSLGVMIFELLEGRPPYLAETVEEVLFKHQDAPIPGQQSEFTPGDVQDLVERMLAKDPAHRPSTNEIIEVLQRHVSIGGPDVHGLEEESWSVAEVEEEQTQRATNPEIQLIASTDQNATVDTAAEESESKPPVWIVGVLAVLAIAAIGVTATVLSGDDTAEPVPTEPAAVVAPAAVDTPEIEPEVEPDPEPEPVEVAEAPSEEPDGEEVDGMEFGLAEADDAPDAGGSEADTGSAAMEPETPQEEPAVEEAPKQVTKKKRRKRRKRRKKNQEKLEEVRLEL